MRSSDGLVIMKIVSFLSLLQYSLLQEDERNINHLGWRGFRFRVDFKEEFFVYLVVR